MRPSFARAGLKKQRGGMIVLGCLWLGLASATALYLRATDKPVSPQSKPQSVPAEIAQHFSAVAATFGPPHLEKYPTKMNATTWVAIYRCGASRIILVIEENTWQIRQLVLLNPSVGLPAPFARVPITQAEQAREAGTHWLR